ncbi:hypothetical protein DSO57_1016835 [Entomophthora muscae]|uniref:Uncharacterized protein n=1 Tax=Entomophthora muscae TaxID=34485 RepID=A0ACC2UQN4_9FUNG|nr:hypothetical protein DSO57_1016835 [Entomophthora muscae]
MKHHKYFCDYCNKDLKSNIENRKKHLASAQHLNNVRLHYSHFYEYGLTSPRYYFGLVSGFTIYKADQETYDGKLWDIDVPSELLNSKRPLPPSLIPPNSAAGYTNTDEFAGWG